MRFRRLPVVGGVLMLYISAFLAGWAAAYLGSAHPDDAAEAAKSVLDNLFGNDE